MWNNHKEQKAMYKSILDKDSTNLRYKTAFRLVCTGEEARVNRVARNKKYYQEHKEGNHVDH